MGSLCCGMTSEVQAGGNEGCRKGLGGNNFKTLVGSKAKAEIFCRP